VTATQTVYDARHLRFVAINNSLLARGRAAAEHTPGLESFPFHVYVGQQGSVQQIEYSATVHTPSDPTPHPPHPTGPHPPSSNVLGHGSQSARPLHAIRAALFSWWCERCVRYSLIWQVLGAAADEDGVGARLTQCTHSHCREALSC
jgi:hypothetical protein